MLLKIQETADYIRSKIYSNPKTGIIVGTGLGNLVTQITEKTEIPYEIIPNFPVSTVEGHSGKLIIAKLGDNKLSAVTFYRRYRKIGRCGCIGHAGTVPLLRRLRYESRNFSG